MRPACSLLLHPQTQTRPTHESCIRRHKEVARCLARVVRRHPGIGVSEAVQRVRRRVPVRAAFAMEVVGDLTKEGNIERRVLGHRHCLFPWRDDLDVWWLQAATLRDDALRLLYELIRDNAWALAVLCHKLQQHHGWAISTTKARVRRVTDSGLVRPGQPGKRNVRLVALPLHPAAQEALQKSSPI